MRMAAMAAQLLAGLWRRLAGPLQWRLLWLTQAKFMVAVSGVVFDADGRVLLLRHRFWPPGSWGLPGGYAKAGEPLDTALARELEEETGCQLQGPLLLRVVSGYRLRVEVIFAARLASPSAAGARLQLDPREVLEARFFGLDQLPAGLLPSHRAYIAQAAAERL